jgi:ribonuclease R
VVSFGLFVELSDLYVEGLVHVSSLQNDYYHFDAPGYRLIGERTGQSYKLGDEVLVQVARVDLDERKIDFELQQLLSRPGGRIGKSLPVAKATKNGGKNANKNTNRNNTGQKKPVHADKRGKPDKPPQKSPGKKAAKKFSGIKSHSLKNKCKKRR